MAHPKTYFFAMILGLVVATVYVVFLTKDPAENSCSEVVQYLEDEKEIDNRILLTPDGTIVFSANVSGSFTLYEYKKGLVNVINKDAKNLTRPFMVQGMISALQDYDGNDRFVSTNSAISKFTNGQAIQSIVSFSEGTLVVFQLRNDPRLLLINFMFGEGKLTTLAQSIHEFHGCHFDHLTNILVWSYDDFLKGMDITTGRTLDFSQVPGEKLNPFAWNNQVYYSSNHDSEYFNIYRTDLRNPLNPPCLVHASNHDVRVPKYLNGELYFIEVINGEYLLKKINSDGNIKGITSKGVVYSYDLVANNNIVFTYSDLYMPRSLLCYKTSKDTIEIVFGHKIKHEIAVSLVDGGVHKSSAYILSPAEKSRGTILFFRPGVHGDFSPRWDSILMNLCINGYTIVAPNYPTSSGFGKRFYESSFAQATFDINKWRQYIFLQYNGPLYYLSVSAGNLVMEQSLVQNPEGINAAVSLFGTTTDNDPHVFSIPTLFILGKNDPIVEYSSRYNRLTNRTSHLTSVITYTDEGHLLRKPENKKDALIKILNFLCQHGPTPQ